jgi:glycosyltransferase involved in cell wall biosynthesis
MPADLVSIVIPVFDGERFVGDAIRAALAQDHPAVEVIVVDDGSTDGTPDVIAQFPTVRHVRQDNRGPSAARNAGIEVATGAFVTFCDSDDRFRPSKVSAQLGYLTAHPEVGCVLVGHETFLEPGVERPAWAQDDSGVQPQSAMVRRGVIDEVGAFDPAFTFAEGMEWLSRMRSRGVGIAVLDKVLVDRRIHDANLSYERSEMRHHLLVAMQQRLASRRAEG